MAKEAVAPAQQAQKPAGEAADEFKAEEYVTPELTEKFEEVFGKDAADDIIVHGANPKPKPKTKPQAQKKVAQEGQPTRRAVARQPAITEESEAEQAAEEAEIEAARQAKKGPVEQHPVIRKPVSQQAQADDGEQEVDDEQPVEAEAQDPGDDQPATLHPLLRLAAKRAGWSDDEIDELYEVKPEAAVKTFERLHSSLNDLSSRFASFASQPPQVAPTQQPVQQQRQQPPPQAGSLDPESVLTGLFGDGFGDRFSVRYGETFADDVLRPLVQQVILPVQQMQAHLAEQQRQELGRTINGFFKDLEGQGFGELYGTGGKLTKEQDNLRFSVVQLADQIATGAAYQGVQMTPKEALDSAHMQMAGGYLRQLERRNLTSRVKQRSRSITAQPTQRLGSSAIATGERSERAALETAAAKMAEIGFED